jgi:hypothetical protein
MLILTVQDIFDRAYLQLRENGVTPVHWSKGEMLKYVNDCLMDVAENAECFKTSAGIEVSENKRRYLVPSNILVPTRIEWDGEHLEEASYEDLDRSDRDWRVRTGDPLCWFVELAPPGYIDLFRVPDADGDDTALSSAYGVVTDISDGTNTYTFSSDYGVITDITSSGDTLVEMMDDYGLITGFFSEAGNLMIFGVGYPDEITDLGATLPRPIHGNYQMVVDYIIYHAMLKDGPAEDIEKAAVFRASYMEKRNSVRTKPRTSTRRRFVRRQQRFDVTRPIGPSVPSTIEE